MPAPVATAAAATDRATGPMLEVDHVSVRFGNQQVLRDINL